MGAESPKMPETPVPKMAPAGGSHVGKGRWRHTVPFQDGASQETVCPRNKVDKMVGL